MEREEALERLKKKRTILRTSLSKYGKRIEEYDVHKECDHEELLGQLSDVYEELRRVDEEIGKLIDIKDLEKDLKMVEEYREKAVAWKYLLKKRSLVVAEGMQRETATATKKEYPGEIGRPTLTGMVKLPKLTMERFYGEISQWLNFWNAFDSSINRNEHLTKIDKFNYLKAYLGGTAAQTVEGFCLSEENYDKAVELLKKRFGKRERLIDVHMNNLLALKPLRVTKDVRAFRELYGRILVQIRSLESLGVVVESYGNLLCPLLLKLLPSDLKLELHREFTGAFSLGDLIEFLERQLIALESTFAVNKRKNCAFCERDHESTKCEFAENLTLEDKLGKLKKKGACFRCLKYGHLSKFCKVKTSCTSCGELRHSRIMCPRKNQNATPARGMMRDETLTNLTTPVVLLPTLRVTIRGKCKERMGRILIDTGSQRSYVLQDTAEEMGYECSKKESLRHSLFGGSNTELYEHGVYDIRLSNLDGSYGCNFEALSQDVICDSVPRVHQGKWMQDLSAHDIELTDLHRGPLEILIGADIAGKLLTGEHRRLPSGLVAVQTRLGWTLMGKIPATEEETSVSGLCTTSLLTSDLENLWRLEAIGISDARQDDSIQKETEEYFARTISQDCEGRYQVALPWIRERELLTDNRDVAEKRLANVRKHLVNTGNLAEYEDILEKWLRNKIIERVIDNKREGVHYLSHRPVFKENSPTTKVRPVFDASAKKKGKLSLNDCLERGPNMIETIPRILNKFRKSEIGVSSDIEKAFLQIGIREEDRDYLRFLWYDKEGNVMRLLASAHFNLRDWTSNVTSIMCDGPRSDRGRLLGMTWNQEKDTLACSLENLEIQGPINKRKVLSLASRIFDPVGFTCPVTLVPRLILQETWLLKLSWDEPLPENLSCEFLRWLAKLESLKSIAIPRWLCYREEHRIGTTLHVFLQARSRVAPLKGTTIPRLELLACLVGARLVNNVVRDLKFEDMERFYWTDSMNALHWIKGKDNWATFVMNRVMEIRSLSETEDWYHVPGCLNPADLPSRGCLADSLERSKWWEGPSWLRRPRRDWPHREIYPDPDIVNSEKRKIVLTSTCIEREKDQYYYRFSNYYKILRVTAWMNRFLTNARGTIGQRVKSDLTVNEIKRAELMLVRVIQRESFTGPEDKRLKDFKLCCDSLGLLRVKTKISRRQDLESFRMPLLLPSDHDLVYLLIRWKHETWGHVGLQSLMNLLREDYWILKFRRTVRRVIHQCVKCIRFTAKSGSVESVELPENRVRDASIFEVVGIDLTGPLVLRNRRKVWIVIFTCAVYRAVHLELVTSLSTENFLQAFRRFVARRGRPYVVYSDNGTNFRGASRALGNLDNAVVQSESTKQNINWKFIPPKILGQARFEFEELYTIICDTESLMNSRPLTYMSEDVEDLSPLTLALFLHDLKEIGVPDLDSIERASLQKRYRFRQRLREDLRKRFRTEYFGFLRQETRRRSKTRPIKVGDLVLIGEDNAKRVNWPLARVVEVYPGRDGPVRVAKLRTSKGVQIGPVQRLYNLEIPADLGSTEAVLSESPLKIRELFAIILTCFHSTNPQDIWAQFKEPMSADIQNLARQQANDGLLQMRYEMSNQALILLEKKFLQMTGFHLTKETSYDLSSLLQFVASNEPKLANVPEQKEAYERILSKIDSNAGGLYFLDAPGGTGKTFLINLLLTKVRSTGDFALSTASSGIAATLLHGGRTAHSTFKLPLDLTRDEVPVCNLNADSAMGEVLRQCKFIVWDECTMAHRHALEAVDITLKYCWQDQRPMGGVVLLLAGDFKQILPIIPRSTIADELHACLKASPLWSFVERLTLSTNMRAVNSGDPNSLLFSQFLLQLGSGPLNDTDGQSILYTSVDSTIDAEDCVEYTTKFLNSLEPSGMPPHHLELRVGVPIILLRNIDAPRLCNGTRLCVKRLWPHVVEATILNGCFQNEEVFIPRIPLIHDKHSILHFKRLQFPIRVSFAMSINKAQGQSLKIAGIDLEQPCFGHGQLYVACSRVGSGINLYVLAPENKTSNFVYSSVLS
ncbi:hypothetical protein LAZ67_20001571 [Cordylochernes scorpioides]|uniref:ATP-dependent DNA helicase n=1 Tax=Cordylochernes scorpioides TaxID=51811 RepID=A0ABY6LPC5_9ARAC|nr:hypothetical protein LAZ67_20001571 [Cordylochernes scorpioides]